MTAVGAVDFDVAIVGSGPVGLVLGVQLAQRGRSVAILEQQARPYTLRRRCTSTTRSGASCSRAESATPSRAISEPAEVYEWRNGQGATLLRFGRTGIAQSGWPFSSMFCQPELEAMLHERAASLPTLKIRRGVRVAARSSKATVT